MLGNKIKLLTITLLTLLSTGMLRAADTQYSASVCGDGSYLFGCQEITPAMGSGTYVKDEGDHKVYLHLLFGTPVTVKYETEITAGQTYLFGCNTYTADGDGATNLLVSKAGCDSTIIMKLKVKAAAEPITVEYSATIDAGQTYLFGCDAYDAAGDYTKTLKRANGADSVVIVHLALNTAEPITVEYASEIEAGQTYLFGCTAYTFGDAETGLHVLENKIPRVGAIAGDSIIKCNLTVKAGGAPTKEDITVQYESTIELGQTYLFGCEAIKPDNLDDVTSEKTFDRIGTYGDSIVKLTLHVIQPCKDTTVQYPVDLYVGEEYILGCTAYSYADPGDYTEHETFKIAGGCDSTVYVKFHVTVPCKDTAVQYNADIYVGDEYVFGCNTYSYTAAGDYTEHETFKMAGGCDSTVYVNFHVTSKCPTEIVVEDTVATVCAKDLPFKWHGFVLYRDTANLDDTLRNVTAQGCDSIVRLQLTVNEVTYTPDGTDDVIICEGDTYKWLQNNKDYSAQGQYFDTVANPLDDCDSLVYTLNLTVQAVKLDTVFNVAICSGDSYEWKVDGRVIGTYTEAKTYFDTLRYATANVNGGHCDSALYTLNLTFHGAAPVIPMVDTICVESLPYEWTDPNDGFVLGTFDKEGSYSAARQYAGGSCDSVTYTLKLKVDSVDKAKDYHEDSKSVYYGYPFSWRDGNEYIITQDTTFRITYKHVGTLGCDSAIYKTHVTVLDIDKKHVYDSATVCIGTIYPEGKRGRVIETDSAWVDSVRVEVDDVPVDMFYHYQMYVFREPSSLPEYLMDSVNAVCGMPLDTAVAQAQIVAYLKENFYEQRIDTNAAITWYVKRAGSFVPRAFEEITASEDEVEYQCIVTDQCGNEKVYTGKLPVNDPPMADLEKEKILVEKYGEWLLMVHVNKLRKLGYVFDEDDVEWYQYVDGVNDILLDNHGYYYTGNEALQGKFYVIIRAISNESGCNAAARSNLVDWSKRSNAPMRLIPNVGHEGTMMRLENINPDQESVIYAYDEAGALMWTKTVSGKTATEIRAQGIPGIYMIRVVTGDKVETLRYIIK